MPVQSFISSLIQNITILLSIVLLYDYFWAREERLRLFYEKIIAGTMIGIIGIVLMSTHWELSNGLIFDARSVLLAISGAFLGAVPTIVAMIITGSYRVFMGGVGLWMGLLSILSSGLIGILWYTYRPKWKKKHRFLELISLGYLVHLFMFAEIFVLPAGIAVKTFWSFLFPGLTVYPIGTALLGMMMEDRLQKWKDKRKRIEMEHLYTSLVEQMPAGVFRKDFLGRYVYVNDLFCQLKGLTKEEIIGKSPAELFDYEVEKDLKGGYKKPPIQRTIVDKGLEHHEWILKHGKPITVQESYLQKNGQVRYFRVVKTPIFDAGGRVVGTQGMQFDISAAKHTDEALRHEQYLMTTLMDNSFDTIFFKDVNSCFLRVNKSQVRLLGCKGEKDVLGKTDFDFFSKEHAQKAFDDEKNVMLTGEAIYNLEERVSWEDGKEIWMNTSKYPFRNKDGKIVGTFGVSKDITPQKRLEIDLLNALNKVEESDRLKTAFLHNISHEIRTPMNSIVGFSGLLKDPDLDFNRKSHMADVIIQSSNQLLSIIDDIVRIATIEAGQERLNESAVKLNSILRYEQEQFASKAKQLNLDFKFNPGLPDDKACIKTDETKFLQTVTNLLVNAFKFTKTGHVYFGYELKGKFLEFFVEDTGIGIPQNMHQEIFKRFSQVDNHLTRQYGGSGLGLSICKAYTELMGGTLTLDSSPGEGTRFLFTVPYYPFNEEATGEPILTESPVAFKVSKEYTILVAEDEEMNFILLKELLRPYKLNIIHAENGLEATNMVREMEQIDLVLMDLKMPVMDGFEATRMIRDFRPELPVLALTAYSQESDKQRAKESGCCEVMIKPIERRILYENLNTYLNLRNPLL
jgi:PAS domain S-box-containing protein